MEALLQSGSAARALMQGEALAQMQATLALDIA